MKRLSRFALAMWVLSSAVGFARQSSQGSNSTTIKGNGDSVSAPITFKTGLLMVGGAFKGTSNFIVQVMGEREGSDSVPINSIGTYSGVRLVPIEAGRYRLSVKADQPWVVMYEQPDPAKVGDPLPISHKMKGDSVMGAIKLNTGLLTAEFSHDGSRNFIVTLYRASGELVGVLANKIGSYKGQHVERISVAGSHYIDIKADGAWSIALSMN